MSLTKGDLLQKFTQGEVKLVYDRRDLVTLKGLSREVILEKIKTRLRISAKEFMYVVEFLLNDMPAFTKDVILSEGLCTVVETQCPHLHDFTGSRGFLVRLDESDSYWSLTESGLEKKSLTGWIGYYSLQLKTNLCLHYKDWMKEHDARLWVVYDLKNGNRVIRPGIVYQTTNQTHEQYYDHVTKVHATVIDVVPDEPRRRLVFTNQKLTVTPVNGTVTVSNPDSMVISVPSNAQELAVGSRVALTPPTLPPPPKIPAAFGARPPTSSHQFLLGTPNAKRKREDDEKGPATKEQRKE